MGEEIGIDFRRSEAGEREHPVVDLGVSPWAVVAHRLVLRLEGFTLPASSTG